MDIGKYAGGKLGPFPVWAWGLILGIFFVVRLYVNGSTVLSKSDTTTPETTGGLSALDQAILSGYSSDGTPIATNNSSGDTTAGTVDETNTMWLAQGVKISIEAGISPLSAEVALQKYIDGYQLSPADQAIINRVIEKLGLPPDGVAAIPSGTAPIPATNYATKVTLSTPTKARFNRLFAMTVIVSATGRKGIPTGKVIVTVNGHPLKTVTLLGGRSLTRVTIKSTEKSPSILTATYKPSGKWVASSTQKSISLS